MMLRNVTKKTFIYGWIYFFMFCTSCAFLFIFLHVHLHESSSRYFPIVESKDQQAVATHSFIVTKAMTLDEEESRTIKNEILYEKFQVHFKDFELTYIMSTPQSLDVCDVDLFIFVLTRPSAFSERLAIRNSWAANLTKNVVLRFIVGKNDDPIVFDMTISEQQAVGDLILYDIEDSYLNLYLKVYVGLQYQQTYCGRAKYVLKTDDDTVVDVDRLLYWINNRFDVITEEYPASIFGANWNGTKVIRDKKNKWYVPEDVYPNETYPAYVNGGTYLLTSIAVNQMLSSAPYVKPITIEDVLFTGVIAEHAMVHRQNSSKFFRNGNEINDEEPCDSKTKNVPYLTAVYGFTNAEMPKAYESLHNVKCIQ